MNPKLQAAIAEWNELKAWLDAAKEKEMTLRKYIAAQLFPEPKEGSNKIVTAGLEAELKHNVNRKVDEPTLKGLLPEFRKYGIPVDALINYKPELVLKQYRMLDPRKQKFFDRALTITDGSPQLSVNATPTKKSK